MKSILHTDLDPLQTALVRALAQMPRGAGKAGPLLAAARVIDAGFTEVGLRANMRRLYELDIVAGQVLNMDPGVAPYWVLTSRGEEYAAAKGLDRA